MADEPDSTFAAYRALLDRYRTQAAGLLVAAWARLENHQAEDADRYVDTISPLLVGVKAATVALTATYVAGRLGARPPAIAARLVVPEVEARRPFLATWHALGTLQPYEDAVASGRAAAESLGHDYVSSAAGRAGDLTARALGASQLRWKRVAESGGCKWCKDRDGGIYLSAKDAVYGHDNCRCDADPIPAAA